MTDTPQTPFHDLDTYVAMPRLGALALSPDGTRVVVSQSVPHEKGTRYTSALWQLDPLGEKPARRLTRGAKGESSPSFTSDGDLLFVASRGEDDAKPAVWRLPAGGGEAHVLVRRPGGVSSVLTARSGERVVIAADTLPSATDEREERRLRAARKDAGVNAILHTGYPIRYWDHDLGPAAARLFAVEGEPLAAEEESDGVGSDGEGPAGEGASTVDAGSAGDPEERGTRDLTPDAGVHLSRHSADLSADGSFLVTTWSRAAGVEQLSDLVRIDVETGERAVLVSDDIDAMNPVISPDGAWVAHLRESVPTPQQAPRITLWLTSADGREHRQLVPDWDRWASQIVWLPDSGALLVTADDGGHSPIFRVPVSEGASAADVTRVTARGAYSNLAVAPDASAVFALRSSYEHPAEPVRVSLTEQRGAGADADGGDSAVVLRGPIERPALPGRLTEVSTRVTDSDGTQVPVRAYLALPEGASAAEPAPLLLWIHGGPLGSWNAWSWRWNPWLLVAQGYAVLLPDPALSTGYGQAFIQRGWGRWGSEPFTDLMAVTDAAIEVPEVDGTRTAAMGGSFGGYMANWVAGHTDRFDGIVTHASLWALDQFGPTTDAATYWAHEMTPEMAEANSPHHFVGDIRTPMLVVHGDKDYRVPIGEGLRLWYELLSASGLPAAADGSTEHEFLYFPDENHWVLTPQHAKVWYQVVTRFLARTVLGETQSLPEELG